MCCRFRSDCEKLASFVQRIERFLMETEDDADMTAPGWEAAFSVGMRLGSWPAYMEVWWGHEDCSCSNRVFAYAAHLTHRPLESWRLSYAWRRMMVLSLWLAVSPG